MAERSLPHSDHHDLWIDPKNPKRMPANHRKMGETVSRDRSYPAGTTSTGSPATSRSARSTYTRAIFIRYPMVRSALSSGFAGWKAS